MFNLVLKHLLPFVLGIFVGTAVFYVLTPADEPRPIDNNFGSGSGSGSGSGACPLTRKQGHLHSGNAGSDTTPFRIISKPAARYTAAARENATEGTVRLKVTLLPDGSVGTVVPVTQLPDGLTEKAIEAAQQIKFEPKKLNGVAVPVTVTIEYSFNIY